MSQVLESSSASPRAVKDPLFQQLYVLAVPNTLIQMTAKLEAGARHTDAALPVLPPDTVH